MELQAQLMRAQVREGKQRRGGGGDGHAAQRYAVYDACLLTHCTHVCKHGRTLSHMHTRTRSRARTQAELKSALSLEKAKAEHDAAWKARQEEEERWLPCLLMYYVCVAYILILIFILRHIHACYTRARTHTQSLSLTHKHIGRCSRSC